jgi:hypothetical protein
MDRIPDILLVVVRELLNPRTGFVWPLALFVFLVRRPEWVRIVRRPSFLLLLIPPVYAGLMSIPYLFSDFVPYQQHVLSSFFRINAHVLLLLLLWLGVGDEMNEAEHDKVR